MGNKDKKLDLFKSRMINCSIFEQLVYSEAIDLLNNDVNPDKVSHWVSMTIQTFDDKPKPLSNKEKQRIEEKRIRKQQKKERSELLNTQMKELLDEYGVFIIGFFHYKEISDSEYEMLSKLVTKNGYFFTDVGDGALEPFISKKIIDYDFIKKYNGLRFELEDLNSTQDTVNKYFTNDVVEFRKKITTII